MITPNLFSCLKFSKRHPFFQNFILLKETIKMAWRVFRLNLISNQKKKRKKIEKKIEKLLKDFEKNGGI
jgi:hypothetical protein